MVVDAEDTAVTAGFLFELVGVRHVHKVRKKEGSYKEAVQSNERHRTDDAR
jgi:hypothetical protein